MFYPDYRNSGGFLVDWFIFWGLSYAFQGFPIISSFFKILLVLAIIVYIPPFIRGTIFVVKSMFIIFATFIHFLFVDIPRTIKKS